MEDLQYVGMDSKESLKYRKHVSTKAVEPQVELLVGNKFALLDASKPL